MADRIKHTENTLFIKLSQSNVMFMLLILTLFIAKEKQIYTRFQIFEYFQIYSRRQKNATEP